MAVKFSLTLASSTSALLFLIPSLFLVISKLKSQFSSQSGGVKIDVCDSFSVTIQIKLHACNSTLAHNDDNYANLAFVIPFEVLKLGKNKEENGLILPSMNDLH